MTTATLSAYPRSVEELLPHAQYLAQDLGTVPSRNHLMRAFKVGAPKATELREALLNTAIATETNEEVTSPAGADMPPDNAEDMAAPIPTHEPADSHPGTAEPSPAETVIETVAQAAPVRHPDTSTPLMASFDEAGPPVAVVVGAEVRRLGKRRRKPLVWPVLLLSLPAFVAIWSGWVELGGMAGFGIVHPLPGIADDVTFNTAITLPIGVETYAAYALWVWLSGIAPRPARRFAKWSAIGSLLFGAAGQIAYHLLAAAGVTTAPWQITSAVACLPVFVLGMGCALAHLQHADEDDQPA